MPGAQGHARNQQQADDEKQITQKLPAHAVPFYWGQHFRTGPFSDQRLPTHQSSPVSNK
jgi:hypothetical protein